MSFVNGIAKFFNSFFFATGKMLLFHLIGLSCAIITIFFLFSSVKKFPKINFHRITQIDRGGNGNPL